jgi:hypothetical protein
MAVSGAAEPREAAAQTRKTCRHQAELGRLALRGNAAAARQKLERRR